MAKIKILLVQSTLTQNNDNGTIRFLENAGYDVVWAGNGISALAATKKHVIDLIVLDVALPDIEGGDLCRRFRAGAETNAVPIILLTARGITPESIVNAADGPDDYVGKPYAESELVGRIFAVLKTKRLQNELELKTRQLKERISQADTMPVLDPDTGLFNQRQFEAMFSKEFKRAQRFKQQLSCMIIDLNGEKIGRKAGEELVKLIIGLIQKTIREVDTAAWWTGDKIIILLPNTMRRDAVQAAARILENVVCQNFKWLDATQITMSIGVAGLPGKNIDTEAKLIEAANAACKRAREFQLLPKNPLAMKSRINK